MKTKTVIIILGILLLGTTVYIGVTEYNQYVSDKEFIIYQQGAYEVLATIGARVMECQQVPITIDNQTITLFAVECLQNSGEKDNG